MDFTGLIIGLAALGLILINQLRARPLDNSFVLPVILAGIGLAEFGALLEGGADQFKAVITGGRPFVVPGDAAVLAIAVIGSLVLAVAGAATRLPTFRLWWRDGRVWRQGGVLTAVLWIASLAAHLGYDAWVAQGSDRLAQLGSATILLYFAVTLSMQRLFLAIRARSIPRDGNEGT